MHRQIAVIIIILSVIWGANACFVSIEADHEGFPCNENQSCEWGLVCIDGFCMKDPCEKCDEGFICVNGICEAACESLADSCEEYGLSECLDGGSDFISCGYFCEEYPDCLVWSEIESCEEDELCIEGYCVPCGGEGEICCMHSVCENNLQCNIETGICEAHRCIGYTIENCGNCGLRTRTCEDGEWSEWGECTGEGECAADENETRECGSCGIQTRICTSSCRWDSWGTCTGEGVCTPGDTDIQDCGNCGTQTRECTSTCEWGSWGTCTGEGACTPGDTDIQECGNCGTQTRTCTSFCEWGSWNECQDDCWYDSASNLIWQLIPTGGSMNYNSALAHCENLSLGGGGWHLPTISELRSLIRGCSATEITGDCNLGTGCMSSHCLNSSCNGCSQSQGPAGGCYWPHELEGSCGIYWSSSSDDNNSTLSWYVFFERASLGNAIIIDFSRVRCVRHQ